MYCSPCISPLLKCFTGVPNALCLIHISILFEYSEITHQTLTEIIHSSHMLVAQHVDPYPNQGAVLYSSFGAKAAFFIIIHIGDPLVQLFVRDHRKRETSLWISLSEGALLNDPFHSQTAHPGDKGKEVFHNLQLLHLAEGSDMFLSVQFASFSFFFLKNLKTIECARTRVNSA